jgi:DNA-binding transcriptional regulator YiaG
LFRWQFVRSERSRGLSVLQESTRRELRRLREVAEARRVVLPEPEECRAIRRRADLTGRELARLIGVAPSTLRCWESGARKARGQLRDRYAAALAILRGEGE